MKPYHYSVKIPVGAKYFRTKDFDNKIYWFENKRFQTCKLHGEILFAELPPNTSIKIITRSGDNLIYRLINGEVERKCSFGGCKRKHFVSGLCNVHSIRLRKGKNMSTPIQKKFIEKCSINGCEQKHEGQGLCKSHLSRKRRMDRWESAIFKMGGKCEICKKSFHFTCYDFHHKNPSEKEYSVSTLIVSGKHDIIENELNKCMLLCANCHRKLHYNIKNK